MTYWDGTWLRVGLVGVACTWGCSEPAAGAEADGVEGDEVPRGACSDTVGTGGAIGFHSCPEWLGNSVGSGQELPETCDASEGGAGGQE